MRHCVGIFTVLSILFLAQNSIAGIQVTRENGNIYFRDTNCETLETQAKAFLSWKLRLNEKPGEYKCECNASNHCQILANPILSDFVKRVYGTANTCEGPNCWNASLLATKVITSPPRHTTESEMAFWAKSPFCKERPLSEKTLPGDLILIRENSTSFKGTEIHAFVYVTDQLTFTKDGPEVTVPYLFKPLEAVLKDNKIVDQKCLRVFGNDESCARYANHFSCTSSAFELITKMTLNDLTEFPEVIRHLRKLECYLSSLSFSEPKLHFSPNLFIWLQSLNRKIARVFPESTDISQPDLTKELVVVTFRSLLKQLIRLQELVNSHSLDLIREIDEELPISTSRKTLIKKRVALARASETNRGQIQRLSNLYNSFVNIHGEDLSGSPCDSPPDFQNETSQLCSIIDTIEATNASF